MFNTHNPQRLRLQNVGLTSFHDFWFSRRLSTFFMNFYQKLHSKEVAGKIVNEVDNDVKLLQQAVEGLKSWDLSFLGRRKSDNGKYDEL